MVQPRRFYLERYRTPWCNQIAEEKELNRGSKRKISEISPFSVMSSDKNIPDAAAGMYSAKNLP